MSYHLAPPSTQTPVEPLRTAPNPDRASFSRTSSLGTTGPNISTFNNNNTMRSAGSLIVLDSASVNRNTIYPEAACCPASDNDLYESNSCVEEGNESGSSLGGSSDSYSGESDSDSDCDTGPDTSHLPYPGFVEVTLFRLKQTHPLRSLCLRVITNPWLERISMLIILFNCITLGMYQPCTDYRCTSVRCQILQVCDDAIYVYFLVEMLVKMVAMGVYGNGSYLAEGWNRLDFFIVVSGLIEYVLDVDNVNLTPIRTIRVLRPLRAINRIPSMRILVMLLLDTLPMLGNVLLLCFFVFFIFGIVGVQMWAGTLRQRCFIQLPPNVSFVEAIPAYFVPRKSSHLTMTSHYSLLSQDKDYICSKEEDNGLHRCTDLPLLTVGDMICREKAQPHSDNVPTASSCVNWNQYYTQCRSGNRNPFQGSISFDNIGMAWVAIFLVISLEGWSDIMYYIQDSHSFWDFVYFVLLIVIGSFFMLNLFLVVIATQFSETKKRETERIRLERARFHSSSTLGSLQQEPSSCYHEILKYLAHLWRHWRRWLKSKWSAYFLTSPTQLSLRRRRQSLAPTASLIDKGEDEDTNAANTMLQKTETKNRLTASLNNATVESPVVAGIVPVSMQHVENCPDQKTSPSYLRSPNCTFLDNNCCAECSCQCQADSNQPQSNQLFVPRASPELSDVDVGHSPRVPSLASSPYNVGQNVFFDIPSIMPQSSPQPPPGILCTGGSSTSPAHDRRAKSVSYASQRPVVIPILRWPNSNRVPSSNNESVPSYLELLPLPMVVTSNATDSIVPMVAIQTPSGGNSPCRNEMSTAAPASNAGMLTVSCGLSCNDTSAHTPALRSGLTCVQAELHRAEQRLRQLRSAVYPRTSRSADRGPLSCAELLAISGALSAAAPARLSAAGTAESNNQQNQLQQPNSQHLLLPLTGVQLKHSLISGGVRQLSEPALPAVDFAVSNTGVGGSVRRNNECSCQCCSSHHLGYPFCQEERGSAAMWHSDSGVSSTSTCSSPSPSTHGLALAAVNQPAANNPGHDTKHQFAKTISNSQSSTPTCTATIYGQGRSPNPHAPHYHQCSNFAPQQQEIAPAPLMLQRSQSTEGSGQYRIKNCRLALRRIIEHRYCQRSILLAIMLNTLSMGLEYHNQPQQLTLLVEISNMIFSVMFALEMMFKIVAYGPLGYISNGFNVFDGVIVIISVIDVYKSLFMETSSSGSNLSVLRTFRLLRILKLVRFMPNLRRQLMIMLRTMDNVTVFFGLLMLFIFIFSVLGMNLFGCQFCKRTADQGLVCDRKNFDSLLWASITVFQILTQEDWNVVLFNGMEQTTPWASLYFVILMTLGNYALFNLLVAILVEGFSSEGSRRRSRMSLANGHTLDANNTIVENNAAATAIQSTDYSPAGSMGNRPSYHHHHHHHCQQQQQQQLEYHHHHRHYHHQHEQQSCRELLGQEMPTPIITRTAATPQSSPHSTLSSRRPIGPTSPMMRNYRSHSFTSHSSAPIGSPDFSDVSTHEPIREESDDSTHDDQIAGSVDKSGGAVISAQPSSALTRNVSVSSRRSTTSSPRIWQTSDADEPCQQHQNDRPRAQSSAISRTPSIRQRGKQSFSNYPQCSTVTASRQSSMRSDTTGASLTSRHGSVASGPVYSLHQQIGGISGVVGSGGGSDSSARSSGAGLQRTQSVGPRHRRRHAHGRRRRSSAHSRRLSSMSYMSLSAAKLSFLPLDTIPLRRSCSMASRDQHVGSPLKAGQRLFGVFPVTELMVRRADWSLYLFAPDCRLRRVCRWLVGRRWFDHTVLVFIALNCISLAMERPDIPPGSVERHFLTLANHVFTAVFAVEMLTKVIARGLLYGHGCYLSSGWNRMDGLLVSISLIDFCMSLLSSGSPKILNILRVFRLLRSLRPLRVINRAPGLKLVVQTLLTSLRPIGNIVFICCTFFIIFGILGVQLFKGTFYHCVGGNLSGVVNKTDCLNRPGHHWVNRKYNFDNLGDALMSLFVLSSKDGWVNIMYAGLDSVGVDMQPIENHSEWPLLYFVSFLLLVGFFVLNMFVGVVVENFHRCREEQEKEERARNVAKRARKMEKRRKKMRETPYYVSYPPWRRKVNQLVMSKYFDLTIATVIGLNIITMATEYYMMPPQLAVALRIFNYFFTGTFTLELALKFVALGAQRYIKDRWNQLDVGIVILSVVGIVLEEMETDMMPVNPTIVRVMRVMRIARVLKLLKMAKGIRALLDTVMQALPQVGNLGLLFFLLFFIFAALGVELFGRLECDRQHPCQGLSEHANFRNFGMAYLTLFRVATGDNWNGIMKDTLRDECDDSAECLKNCCVSRVVAPLFFVVFVLMAQFVLVNVVVAVLMKHLEDSHKQMEEDVIMERELERQMEQERRMEEMERVQKIVAGQVNQSKSELVVRAARSHSLPKNFTFHATAASPRLKTPTITRGCSSFDADHLATLPTPRGSMLQLQIQEPLTPSSVKSDKYCFQRSPIDITSQNRNFSLRRRSSTLHRPCDRSDSNISCQCQGCQIEKCNLLIQNVVRNTAV